LKKQTWVISSHCAISLWNQVCFVFMPHKNFEKTHAN
jgi:hypothetical protein